MAENREQPDFYFYFNKNAHCVCVKIRSQTHCFGLKRANTNSLPFTGCSPEELLNRNVFTLILEYFEFKNQWIGTLTNHRQTLCPSP
jgi:hypothetical protein